MIVSHEHRFIFLKTRKTAGTSIEIALSSFCGDRDVLTRLSPDKDEPDRLARTGRSAQNDEYPFTSYRPRDWARLVRRGRRRKAYHHMPAAEVRAFVGERVWDGYFKFAFTRNPFDVAVSMQNYVGRRTGRQQSLGEFLRSRNGVDLVAANYDIYSLGDTVAVDQVGRFESLQEDFDSILDHLHLPRVQLTHAKRTVDAARDQRLAAFDPADVDLVSTRCALELDAFGYSFEG